MKIYIARQPIYRVDKTLFGYELLYRNSEKNVFPGIDGNKASRELVYNALSEFQLFSAQKNKGRHHYFINFTRDVLLSDIPLLLDPDDVVIEILEDVQLDPALVQRIAQLKEQHYVFALDDFVDDDQFQELFPHIDIIKVEYSLLSRDKCCHIARKFKNTKRMIAERIETQADLDNAIADGYELFQGYFFSKPILSSKTTIDIAATSYTRLLHEMSVEVPDYNKLAGIVEKDVALTYKLLFLVNTAAFYREHRIKSVKQALIHLGLVETRRWIMILLLREVNTANDDEMTKLSLVRALFMETLMGYLGLRSMSEAAYMVGMLSGIENVLNSSITEIIDDLKLSPEIRRAFTVKDNILSEALACIKDYERCCWKQVDEFCRRHKLSQEVLTSVYAHAVKQADSFFEMEGSAF